MDKSEEQKKQEAENEASDIKEAFDLAMHKIIRSKRLDVLKAIEEEQEKKKKSKK